MFVKQGGTAGNIPPIRQGPSITLTCGDNLATADDGFSANFHSKIQFWWVMQNTEITYRMCILFCKENFLYHELRDCVILCPKARNPPKVKADPQHIEKGSPIAHRLPPVLPCTSSAWSRSLWLSGHTLSWATVTELWPIKVLNYKATLFQVLQRKGERTPGKQNCWINHL